MIDRDLAAARGGDEQAFARLVAPHRVGLHAHCYRMLGSVHDADDALQDTLVGAWRGLPGYERRSSLRTWLYRIATHAALRVADRRRRHRVVPMAAAPPRRTTDDLGAPLTEVAFIEPYPDDDLRDWRDEGAPEARYDRLESVELAFVAALQTLPATQRAVVLLREVLGVPAAEVAEILDTSVTSVNSALQRGRRTLDERAGVVQQSALRTLGDDGQRRLVGELVSAWERRDIDALVALLTADVRFTMPPLPAWFDGREDVARFFATRVFERPWRLRPMRANGQLAVAGWMGEHGAATLPFGGLVVLSVRDGRLLALDSFVDPMAAAPFGLPGEVSSTDR